MNINITKASENTCTMRFLFLSISIIFLLASCSNKDKREANRSSLSGGTLKINESESYVTLYPPSTRDIVSAHIINQIHLGLVKYDVKNLSVLPAIAKDWDLDNTGTVYTFHLDPDAKFHDDPCFLDGEGRTITAEDFKYTFKLLCTQSESNKNFFGTVDKIDGAKQYYKESANGTPSFDLESIEVVNDSTLKIKIEKPYDLFIYYMANPACVVLAKEAVEKYGTNLTVGSGAFTIESLPQKNDPLFLVRNENFFQIDEKGFQLPYLDSVRFTFVSSTKTEVRLFVEDQLDMVLGLGSDYINDFLDEHIDKFESNPPQYVLNRSEKMSNSGVYNLLKSDINNFYTNKMDNLDLSIVYIRPPKPNDQRTK